ncbi:DUF4932 domain-containing protein [Urechidicola vernalis]|uniref:DUF4932 domain-containing protein n=1 Tax=Urechidicola vernalis TaxID=3075600 RepID=A0ABU2Y4Q0_9FLAO|nr:DUF4932 domain-containing protein [Urechidicola sp. P050]MDT0553130.1 DUF4932 domain-containing protein [Urechidicola sp. P050]
MKTLKILLFLFLSISIFSQHKEVAITFKKNTELFGYIIELADPSENDKNNPIYKIIHSYEEDLNNDSMTKIFEIGGSMGYGFLENFCYILPELPFDNTFDIENHIRNIYEHLSNEKSIQLIKLANALNQFALTSNFQTVFDNLEPYRDKIQLLLEENKPSFELLQELETFYNRKFENYIIVPSITIWPSAAFGGFENNMKTAVFTLGPLEINFNFSNSKSFKELAIHEFGHSFVNDHVLKNSDIIKETNHLFSPMKETMYPQGYHNWETCLIEHFVRAGEVIIPELLNDAESSNSLMDEYVKNRQFNYLPFIVEKLKYYRLVKKYTYNDAVRQTLIELKNIPQ